MLCDFYPIDYKPMSLSVQQTHLNIRISIIECVIIIWVFAYIVDSIRQVTTSPNQSSLKLRQLFNINIFCSIVRHHRERRVPSQSFCLFLELLELHRLVIVHFVCLRYDSQVHTRQPVLSSIQVSPKASLSYYCNQTKWVLSWQIQGHPVFRPGILVLQKSPYLHLHPIHGTQTYHDQTHEL